MAITREELENLINIGFRIDKRSRISSDGKNLLVRIPKRVRDYLKLKKGDEIRWLVSGKKEIRIEIIKSETKNKV